MPEPRDNKIKNGKQEFPNWFERMPGNIRIKGNEMFFNLVVSHNISEAGFKFLNQINLRSQKREGRLTKADWTKFKNLIDDLTGNQVHYYDHFKPFGILHQSFLYFAKLIFNLCRERAKKTIGQGRQTGNLKYKYDREKGIFPMQNNGGRLQRVKEDVDSYADELFERTWSLMLTKPEYGMDFINDAIQEISYDIQVYLVDNEDELGINYDDFLEHVGDDGVTTEQDDVKDFLQKWADKNRYGVDILLAKVIQHHRENIVEAAEGVKLDEEFTMKMPESLGDKSWEYEGEYGKREVKIHKLDTEKDLELEGLMANNCVDGDNWVKRVERGKQESEEENVGGVKIFSIGIEVPEGVKLDKTDEHSDKLIESFETQIDDEFKRRFKFDLYKKYYNATPSFMGALEILSKAFRDKDKDAQYYNQNWDSEMEKFYQERLSQLNKNLETKVCRIPKITIEYDVKTKTIKQIKAYDNAKIGSNDWAITLNEKEGLFWSQVVFEAIAEICKYEEVVGVKDLGEFHKTKYFTDYDGGLFILKDGRIVTKKFLLDNNLQGQFLKFE